MLIYFIIFTRMATSSRLNRAERNRQFSNTSELSEISCLSQKTQMTDVSDNSTDTSDTDTTQNRRNLSKPLFSLDGAETEYSAATGPIVDREGNTDDSLVNQLITLYDSKSSTPLNTSHYTSDSDSSTVVNNPYIHPIDGVDRTITSTPTTCNAQLTNKHTRPQFSLDNSNTGCNSQSPRYMPGQVASSQRRRQLEMARNAVKDRTPSECLDNSIESANTDFTKPQRIPRCLEHEYDVLECIRPKDSYESCNNCMNLQRHAKSYPRDVTTLVTEPEKTNAVLNNLNTWPSPMNIVVNPLDAVNDTDKSNTNLKRVQSTNEVTNHLIANGERNRQQTRRRDCERSYSESNLGYLRLDTPSSGTPQSVIGNLKNTDVTNCQCDKFMRRQNSFRKWVFCLICFNVILIICVFLLIMFIFVSTQISMNCCTENSGTSPTQSSQRRQFEPCVDPWLIERKFQLHRSELQDITGLDVIPSDGVCFDSMTQIMALLNKALTKMTIPVGNQTAIMRPLIHVRGKSGAPTEILGQRGHRRSYALKWSHLTIDSGRLQKGGIKLSSDASRFTVSETGHYFVYNRLHFRFHKTQNEAGKPLSISHWLMKASDVSGDVELDGVHQNCWLKGGNVEHTSALETLVYLQAGDSLFVQVRGIESREHLENNGNNHRFGLFLV